MFRTLKQWYQMKWLYNFLVISEHVYFITIIIDNFISFYRLSIRYRASKGFHLIHFRDGQTITSHCILILNWIYLKLLFVDLYIYDRHADSILLQTDWLTKKNLAWYINVNSSPISFYYCKRISVPQIHTISTDNIPPKWS